MKKPPAPTIQFDWSYTDAQLAFMEAVDRGTRCVGGICGIKWGKSTTGARAFLKQFYGSRKALPPLGWLVAPTYAQSLAMERHFVNAAAPLIRKSYKSSRGGGPVYLLEPSAASYPFQIRVEIRTAEKPGNLRGPSVPVIWVDEPAEIYYGEECFDVLMGRGIDCGGTIIFTGTPKGYNWMYERIWKPCQAGDPSYAVIRGKTEDNCIEHNHGFIPHAEIERLRATYSAKIAQQELDGDFVSYDGLVYSSYIPKDHTEGGHLMNAWPLKDKPVRTIVGIDFGYQHPFGAVRLRRTDQGRWIVTGVLKGAQLQIEYWATELKRWKEEGVDQFYADPEDITARNILMRYGITAIPAKKDRREGIQHVQKLFEKNQLYLIKDQTHDLQTELLRHQYKGNGTEDVVKEWDDACDAMRYGLFTEFMYYEFPPGEVKKPRVPNPHPTEPTLYSTEQMDRYISEFNRASRDKGQQTFPDWYTDRHHGEN